MELTAPRATIYASIIAVIGIVIGAFLKPIAEKWIDSTPRAPEQTALAIEQIPLDIFAYAGNNDPDGGSATFVLINDQEKIPTYKLDYSLPTDRHGYAGLAFNFHKGMNLTDYRAIECVLTFSQLNDSIDLYFKDISDNFNTIRVVNNGTSEMILRYEFNNFPNVNFNAVKEVGLVASTDFMTETHQVVIKKIRFVQ